MLFYYINKRVFNRQTGALEDWDITVAKDSLGDAINEVASFVDEYGTTYSVTVKSSNIGRAIKDTEELIDLYRAGNVKGGE